MVYSPEVCLSQRNANIFLRISLFLYPEYCNIFLFIFFSISSIDPISKSSPRLCQRIPFHILSVSLLYLSLPPSTTSIYLPCYSSVSFSSFAQTSKPGRVYTKLFTNSTALIATNQQKQQQSRGSDEEATR